jgi:regulator of cell morphogenesis and NO signaling
MAINGGKTVGQLALEDPAVIPVFENLGIDYCCGGSKSLREACAAANVSLDKLLLALEQGKTPESDSKDKDKDWQREPLFGLIAHIVEKHHYYVRRELVHLDGLFTKTCSAHGDRHPEVLRMANLFRELSRELLLHMSKEEQVLFPQITAMEERLTRNEPPSPPHFYTPCAVQVMMREHESAGSLLQQIRAVSCNYRLPADACTTWKVLYELLQEFERDLHRHIHLENNVLFPRTLEMERAALQRSPVAG